MKVLFAIMALSISSTCFAFFASGTTVADISDAWTSSNNNIESAHEDFNKVVWNFLSTNHKVSNVEQLLNAVSKTRSPSVENEKEEAFKSLMERFAITEMILQQHQIRANFDIKQVSSFSETKTINENRNGFLLEVVIESSISSCFRIEYTTYILLEKGVLESAIGKDRGVQEKIRKFTFPCFG